MLCMIAERNGNNIAIEWPTKCSYWKWKPVQDLIHRHSLMPVHIHGCAMGVKDEKGRPLLKPWTVYTNHLGLYDELSDAKYRCDGTHEHSTCTGKRATMSSGYTRDMAKTVHMSLRSSVELSKKKLKRSKP